MLLKQWMAAEANEAPSAARAERLRKWGQLLEEAAATKAEKVAARVAASAEAAEARTVAPGRVKSAWPGLPTVSTEPVDDELTRLALGDDWGHASR